jgi:hypothetical protein
VVLCFMLIISLYSECGKALIRHIFSWFSILLPPVGAKLTVTVQRQVTHVSKPLGLRCGSGIGLTVGW